MIRVSEQAAREAFKAFCARRRKWVAPIGAAAASGGQLEMYRSAARAFGDCVQIDDFRDVYQGLKRWKVGRAGALLQCESVFEILAALDRGLHVRELSTLGPEDWPKVWDAISRLRDVKQTKKGEPRVMAVSKFLHFWNPRLFVICDLEEVEGFVFGHRWLASELDNVRWVLGAAGADENKEPSLSKYLRVLALGSEFVKANPFILPEFARTVGKISAEDGIPAEAVPADIKTYEATAVEWCLIGLAEMMPSGVEVILGDHGSLS